MEKESRKKEGGNRKVRKGRNKWEREITVTKVKKDGEKGKRNQ